VNDPSTAAGSRVLSDRYVLHERVGIGGAGEVWRGHDRVLQRQVAVKLLNPEIVDDADATARFRAEATAAAKLTHPHAVMVFDIGRDGDQDYLVMELVEGTTLEQVLAGGPLPPGVVAALGSQLGRALGAAHARGLVHRDVKPGNVLITREGVAKLTDFGIARALGEATTRITRPGDVMGTARYLAPEQLDDREVDARADVYALGLLLHQAVTGHPPFGEGTAVEVAMRRLSAPLPRASELRADVPPALDDALERATQRDTERRFADGSELAAVLSQLAAPLAARLLAARVAGRPDPEVGAAPAAAAPTAASGAGDPASTAAAGPDATRPLGGVSDAPTLTGPAVPQDTPDPAGSRRSASSGRGPRRWPLWAAAGTAVLVLGAAIIGGPGDLDAPASPDAEPIAVVDGGDHDPFGSGDEHPAEVPNAFDGDRSTFWRTERYRGNPELGGLKPGVGIWLDLGAPLVVGTVVVSSPDPGAAFSVYAGDTPPAEGEAPDDWGRPVATVASAGEEERIELDGPTDARVWLLWFTSLPPDGDRFRATVSDVRFEPA
jgi:eukaryotic-like serine/threonine-protein kinase